MNLAEQVASPSGGVLIVPGTADIYPLVKVGGLSQPAAWPAGVYAAPGDQIFVAQLVKPDAPAQNVVLGRVGADGPREGTVTTVPGGSDTITVTTDGVGYKATFLTGYTPTVGDRVRLFWQGRDVTVLGAVGVTPDPDYVSPAPGTAPPPPPVSSGVFNAPATDSATFWGPGGWDSWAGGGGHIHQGTWAGSTLTGAWFYGNTMAELAGATISRIQFRVPARRTVGSYNTAGNLHLHAHTSPSRPGGDVTRSGLMDVSIPPGWAPEPDGGWFDLPLSYAPTLIGGGGISIAGDPYMGFVGKPSDPASGQLRIEWSR